MSPTPSRRRTPAPPREDVLAAAMEMIAERGLEKLTMAALGREVGMSSGHLLYYFHSKDELPLQVLEWSEGRLGAQRGRLLGRTGTARERLDAYIDLYLPDGHRDPHWTLWLEVWNRSQNAAFDAGARDRQAAIEGVWHRDLVALIAEGVSRGSSAASTPTGARPVCGPCWTASPCTWLSDCGGGTGRKFSAMYGSSWRRDSSRTPDLPRALCATRPIDPVVGGAFVSKGAPARGRGKCVIGTSGPRDLGISGPRDLGASGPRGLGASGGRTCPEPSYACRARSCRSRAPARPRGGHADVPRLKCRAGTEVVVALARTSTTAARAGPGQPDTGRVSTAAGAARVSTAADGTPAPTTPSTSPRPAVTSCSASAPTPPGWSPATPTA